MKNTSLVIITTAFLLAFTSCSNKNDQQIGCTAQYIFPSLNFQVVNTTDLTMPVYAPTDIKIYFKNNANQKDSLNAVLSSDANRQYFSFIVQRAKVKDTCFIKIRSLKPDTLVYTITNTSDSCPHPYINTVTINNLPPAKTAPGAVIQIIK